jgi:ribosomal protein S1
VELLATQEGTEAHGYVLGVKPNVGVVVGFFNGVRGLVRKSELGQQFTDDPESSYRVGQVVSCKVVSCDSEKKRLLLSFGLSSTAQPDNQGTMRAFNSL